MTIEIIVSGRVQEVWFRKFTKQKTDEIGVCDHVQNMVNGKVKIVVEARKIKLPNFAWAKIGSSKSGVESVAVELIQNELDFEDYRIIKA